MFINLFCPNFTVSTVTSCVTSKTHLRKVFLPIHVIESTNPHTSDLPHKSTPDSLTPSTNAFFPSVSRSLLRFHFRKFNFRTTSLHSSKISLSTLDTSRYTISYHLIFWPVTFLLLLVYIRIYTCVKGTFTFHIILYNRT